MSMLPPLGYCDCVDCQIDKELQPKPIVRKDKDPIVHLVITDMLKRMQEGEKKYGAKLTAFNGRSALRDAYEEAMDLTLYLKQKLEEESEDE